MTDIDSKKMDDRLEDKKARDVPECEPFTWTEIGKRIIWRNVIFIGLYHVACIGALIMYTFNLHPNPLKWRTILWVIFVAKLNLIGILGGAHRLWSHRSYKARLPLKILLMIFYCSAGMNSLFSWARDHRVHHQYTDTDADPHTANRGFFYSHVGWLMMEQHPDCVRRSREVNVKDILADPVVMFEKKYHHVLRIIFCFVFPTAVPIIIWKETFFNAVLTQCFIRYVFVLNATFCVNSVAHFWGYRPYNRSIRSTENWFVSLITGCEGSHNYHHTFAWDYRAAELPWSNLNSTTMFIDLMAELGWAYDLRHPSPELIDNIVNHVGDKSVRGNH